MSLKLKALGLGLLAALAMGASAVIDASAETGGHLTWSGDDHIIVIGEQPEDHGVEITFAGDPESGIICEGLTGEATIQSTNTTVDTVTVSSAFGECETTDGTPVEITTNGCAFWFTGGKEATPTVNTLSLVCPGEKKYATVNHPFCEIRVPAANYKGIGAHRITVEGKHAITGTIDVSFTVHYEKGLCVFLGTSHTVTMEGTAVVTGFDTEGNRVDITATGSND